MAIEIEIFERVKNPAVDEEVFAANWKSQSLEDSLYKYYYYPIRRPEDPDWVSHSVVKFLYGKISGTYQEAKRVRWKLSGGGMTDGVRLYVNHRNSYQAPPTNDYDGSLILVDRDPYYIYPNLSTVGPADADTRINTLSANTTYYTDFLVSQVWTDDSSGYVGNTDVITFQIELDEYE